MRSQLQPPIDDAEFAMLIEQNLPQHGVLKFEAFEIPLLANSFEFKGETVPLRCWPGDARVGLFVLDHAGNLIYVSSIEIDGKTPRTEVVMHIKKCLGVIITNATDGFAQA